MRAALAPIFEDEHDRTIFVRSDPNGVAFDREAGALFVADARDGSILRVDGDRSRKLASIDSGGVVSANRLGGLAAAPDGTLYVARLGYGHAGAVFRIDADGQTEAIPGLSARYWRLGVTYDAAEHALYTTQFLKSASGPFDGAVIRVDLATGGVTRIAENFLKPAGVAKLGSTLVVTDTRQRALYRVELDGQRVVWRTRVVLGGDRPDSVCACDAESVLVTCYDEATRCGSLRRVWLDGRTRTLATGAWEPRGVAFDGERAYVSARRLGRVLALPV